MPENEKQTNKERLKDITDSIERGIEELFQSDKYAEYLRTMSRFHKYSVNNTMLIYMQRPDATLVAGFNKWRDQFERNVMKGEKGIKIIAPTPFKKKIEQEKRDPDTNLPMLDADGKVVLHGLSSCTGYYSNSLNALPDHVFAAQRGFYVGWMDTSGNWLYCQSIFSSAAADDEPSYGY